MASTKKHYPLSSSLFMITAAILLSFVDLMFLNDVIGKVLDLGVTESMLIACAIGLIGIALMAHLGMKLAHGLERKTTIFGYYALWVVFGLALVTVRIFSATIMQLDTSLGDQSMMTLFGQNIRQMDAVTAPLMFFMYLATGLLVKDGVKNLFLNPDFEKWDIARKKDRASRKSAEDKRRLEAEAKMAKQRAQAEESAAATTKRIEEGRIQSALNGSYSNALAQFRAKEKEIKTKYKHIAENTNYIKSIDKQENDFEAKVKPGLRKIIDDSIHSTQNSVALALRKKTGEDITELRREIESYNTKHHG